MNVKVRCDVCFEAYSLDMFRFLPICGHGLCIVCSEQTLTKPNCVICRQPKRSLEPVQIFLTFAETSPSDKAHSVVENLNRIGPDSMPISVQKAGRKIRHVLRDIEPEDEVAVSPESNTATQLLSAEPAQQELLDAAKNLDERIYPLFLELDLANDTIATLNVEIQELRRQLKVAAFQEAEMKQLRRSLTEAKTEYKAAVALVAKTKEAVLKERSDNSRLSHTVQRQLSELSSKEGDNDLLRAKLIRRDNRISLLEKKLKILSRTARHPKPDANDPNESLQIDNSAEGIRITRQSNDWLEPRVVKKNASRVLKRIQPLPDIEL